MQVTLRQGERGGRPGFAAKYCYGTGYGTVHGYPVREVSYGTYVVLYKSTSVQLQTVFYVWREDGTTTFIARAERMRSRSHAAPESNVSLS